jgi:uncharacterized membrane protein
MRAIMIQEDVSLVESRIQRFEERTGCELLLVVTNTADPYPAAPLRFGLIAGFLISLVFAFYFEFQHALLWPLSFLLIVLAMSAIGRFPWAKRLALSDWEVQRECNEKAIEFFHTLGTSKVGHKVTAMIMVAALERHIEVRVDETLSSKLGQADLDQLVGAMKVHFAKGNMAAGMIQSMDILEEKILSSFGGKVSDLPPSELKDTVHFITV